MISPGYYFQIKEQFSPEYPQQKNNKLKTKWACFFALEFFMLFWPLYPKKEIKRGKTFLKVSEKKKTKNLNWFWLQEEVLESMGWRAAGWF